MIQSRRPSRQHGASLISMLVLAILVCCVLLMGARIFPSINEYLTIRKVVTHIMAGNPGSPSEVRNLFDKAAEVEYSIKTISGKDLKIQVLGDSGNMRTSYDYNVEVPVFEPTVYILIKYAGSASTGGVKGP